MSQSRMSFIIFKAYSEEKDSVDSYVSILKDRGYEAQIVPTLEFKYHNLDVLKSKLQNPQNYSGMVLTSPRCVRGVIKCLDYDKLDANWCKKPIFVVGETTSRLLTKELNIEPVGAESGNAMALIPIILKYELNKPLLAPCGNLNINILSNNIKNVEFENIEVYQTIPHSDLKTNLNLVLDQTKVHNVGVIFFSPSGFHAILDLIPKQFLSKIHIFAIGPTTGSAVKDAGYTLNGVCEKPNPESMIDMIDRFNECAILAE